MPKWNVSYNDSLGLFRPHKYDCRDGAKWLYYVALSCGALICSVSLVLLFRLYSFIMNKLNVQPEWQVADYDKDRVSTMKCSTEAKDWAGELISGQTTTGRVLIVLVFILSLASFGIFAYEGTTHKYLEFCAPWKESVTQQIDLAFNVIFLIYLIIRFIAAEDKLMFCVDLHSIVDFFTITPTFFAVYMQRSWIGFRCMRAMRIMSLPDVLQYLNILRTSNSIRFLQLITMFCSSLLCGAGLIHLLENTELLTLRHVRLGYCRCVYFLIVTVSTVGYGDVVCKSPAGQILMMFVIMGGLATFANAVPEIAEIVGSRSKYGGSYHKEAGKQHIVLCGHISYDSISTFLGDFLHKDREDVDIQIVILHQSNPDLELLGLIKRHFTQVFFFQGSVMNSRDLKRVSLSTADACLVLANKSCNNPDSEDSTNIMRVISIKNFKERIRVIIQLLQDESKKNLMNIPNWDWKIGDDVVCLAELKLGLMAQSCLAPGVSTLLANLFTMRSSESDNIRPTWLNEYLVGAGMEMYTEYFSPSFVNKNFVEAAQLCFRKLNLLLIAIESKSDSPEKCCTIAINPRKDDVLINTATQGFFIAESADDVKRVYLYCQACHGQTQNPLFIKKCRCKEMSNSSQEHKRRNATPSATFDTLSPSEASMPNHLTPDNPFRSLKRNYSEQSNMLSKSMTIKTEEGDVGLDSTGMFHYIHKFSHSQLQNNRLMVPSLQGRILENHVVVCIITDCFLQEAPLVGLRNFITPLRTSNLLYEELKDIIVICEESYYLREWESIKYFPKVYLLPGKPKKRNFLREACVDRASMCVILSCNIPMMDDESCFVDKDSILCCLNIQSLTGKDNDGNDKPVIPLITELSADSNVQFIDQDDEDDPDTELYMTQPFACGRAFAVSVLDSLMSTAYFNENALTFIRTLVTGNATRDTESTAMDGASSGIPRTSNPDVNQKEICNRERCRLANLPISEGVLDMSNYRQNSTYGDLFDYALTKHGILCIGIYRCIRRQEEGDTDKVFSKRYIITNPPADMHLFADDYAVCFQPSGHRVKSPVTTFTRNTSRRRTTNK